MLHHPCILGGGGDAKRGEQYQERLPHLAFSGAQKRAEMVHHPCIPKDPLQRAAK